jgi:hypothetical protein
MTEKREPLRIGCFSGFWGDSASGAFQLTYMTQIHYLVGDYLSEVTMGILAKSKVTICSFFGNQRHNSPKIFSQRIKKPLRVEEIHFVCDK